MLNNRYLNVELVETQDYAGPHFSGGWVLPGLPTCTLMLCHKSLHFQPLQTALYSLHTASQGGLWSPAAGKLLGSR